MTSKRLHKLIHFCATGWFIACASFLLTLAMRQAGAAWWLIFSLSGYSAVLAFVLTSIYLFAVYRGVVRSRTEQEYPLTSSIYYMTFYDICPFLGAIAGVFSVVGSGSFLQQFSMVASGSLGTTFLVWIVLDPIVGLIEMCLPTSRELRHKRIAEAKAERQRIQSESNELLKNLGDKENTSLRKWQPVLEPLALTLAKLISSNEADYRMCESHAVEIGAKAWSLGGIACMQRLHKMAIAGHVVNYNGEDAIDYISIWWDGIGTWRKPLLVNILS